MGSQGGGKGFRIPPLKRGNYNPNHKKDLHCGKPSCTFVPFVLHATGRNIKVQLIAKGHQNANNKANHAAERSTKSLCSILAAVP